MRISKGTVITGDLLPNKLEDFQNAKKEFQQKIVKYEAYSPKKYTPFLEELYLDLRDLDDKSILTLKNSDLLASLKISGEREVDRILSVEKIYPRKPVTTADYDKFISFRIGLKFSKYLPEKVYLQNVSIPITPYIRPPKRCFTCQRLGHSAISCKRKSICPFCAENHSPSECNVDDTQQFKCTFCKGNHKAPSTSCKYYKEALKIATDLQRRAITQEDATKLYTKLY